MGSHNYLVLVEGKDDLHVIGHLLHQHDIVCQMATSSPRPPDMPIVFLQETGGITRLLSSLPIRLNNTDLQRVAIVLDSDEDVAAGWQAIKTKLAQIGQIDLPNEPNQAGTVTTLYLEKHEVVVGIWLMPNNREPGILEDFVQQMIPQPDPLWKHAQQAVATVPIQHFSSRKQSKAEIHTWLAWQAEPGRPLGVSVRVGVLTLTAVSAQSFITWIRQTFSL